MTKNDLEIPEGEKCCVCSELATEYCPYCVDEYESAPRFVPTVFYCAAHYQSVVETGNCCSRSEEIWGFHENI